MDKTWSEMIVLLEGLGWSVTALAEAIELSPTALSDLKHGRSKAPTGMAAVKLHHLASTGQRPSQQAA